MFDGQSDQPINCRRSDGGIFDDDVDPRIIPYLIRAGFYGVYRVGRIQYDHALLTAMLERWRQETHTFHLPIGEATVTLQDVSIIYGLPIDGRAVTGSELQFTIMVQNYNKLHKLFDDIN